MTKKRKRPKYTVTVSLRDRRKPRKNRDKKLSPPKRKFIPIERSELIKLHEELKWYRDVIAQETGYDGPAGDAVNPLREFLRRGKPKRANDTQHGGAHYKSKKIEPWDYIAANGLGYFEGSAIKYITRWPEKGGLLDVRKAIHYLEKLVEITEEEHREVLHGLNLGIEGALKEKR